MALMPGGHSFILPINLLCNNIYMKRFNFILSLVAVVLTTPIFAQFEGVIEMGVNASRLGGQEVPVIINVKGDRAKMVLDMPQTGEIAVYSDSSKKVITVMAAMNMGFEIDFGAVENSTENIPAPQSTGKKNTVNGYACDEWTCTPEAGLEISMWMTKEMPKNLSASIFNALEKSMQGISGPGAFKQLFADGYIPVQTVVKKNGNAEATVTFKKFEEKSLADAIFEIPTNITIQKMDPSMMGK